jgi:hypothetical protein
VNKLGAGTLYLNGAPLGECSAFYWGPGPTPNDIVFRFVVKRPRRLFWRRRRARSMKGK